MSNPNDIFNEWLQKYNRSFINRKDEIDSIKEWLKGVNQSNILMIYGIGGIGKTSLKDEFLSKFEKDDHKILVNLDLITPHYHRTADFLFQIRLQLGKKLGISFHNFDLAYTIYFKTVSPTISLKEPASLLEEGNLIAEIINNIRGIVVFETIFKMVLLVKKGSRWFNKWYQNRQTEFQAYIELAENRKINEMENILLLFLVKDLQENKKSYSQKTILICVDNIDFLTLESKKTLVGEYNITLWFRDILWRLSLVKWIIIGRNKIKWEQLEKRWMDNIKFLQVNDLANSYCKVMLEKNGIKDERWKTHITNQSHGVPLYIQLSVETVNIARLKGRKLNLGDFKPDINELLTCFLKYLDRDEESALFLLAIPRFFTETLWNVLFNEFFPAFKSYSLKQFSSYSFITKDDMNYYYIHPLIRELLLEHEAKSVVTKRHEFLSEYYAKDAQVDDIKNIGNFQINALQEALYHRFQLYYTADLSKWVFKLLKPYKEAGFYDTVLQNSLNLLEVIETRKNIELEDLSLVLINTAISLREMGRYRDSESLYNRNKKICRNNFGEKSEQYFISLKHLLDLYLIWGQLEKAKFILIRVFKLHKLFIDDEPTFLADVYDSCAAYLQRIGRIGEAKKYAEKSLRITKNHSDSNYLDVARRSNNLAGILSDLGQYKQVKTLYQNSLNIYKENLGIGHPSTARVMNNLGSFLTEIQEFNEAEELHRKSLDISINCYGVEHPISARRMNNLALLLNQIGKYEEAEQLQRKSISITEEICGLNHPETATRMNNLALILIKNKKKNNFEETEQLMRTALSITERSLKSDHPTVIKRLNNLASLLRDHKKFDESKSFYQRALNICDKKLDKSHPLLGKVANEYGFLLLEQKKYKKAENFFNKSLKNSEKLYGTDHPRTAIRLANLARIMHETGKLKKAEKYYRRAVRIAIKSLKPNHPVIGIRLYHLGFVLEEMGNYEEAMDYYQKALEFTSKNYGGVDFRTKNIINRITNLKIEMNG